MEGLACQASLMTLAGCGVSRIMRAPAQAVIDLAAISHNVALLRERAASALLMAVVKADGYGHGMVPCARAALEAGAAWPACPAAGRRRGCRPRWPARPAAR